MAELFANLVDEVRRSGRAAICVVVGTRGSTPQEAGAKMIVACDGRTVGTLGGGCVEAEVRQTAIQLATSGESRLLTLSLDHDYGWDDGLICGGVMEILIHIVVGDEQARPFAEIADAVRGNRSAHLRLPIPGVARAYEEDLGPPPVLVIAGAGHVGQALAATAAGMGFVVDVVDDRPEYASTSRFPSARQVIVAEIETTLRDYPADAETYVVIVTRGHRNDGRALAAVVNGRARYIGLIGSKSKIKQIFDDLHQSGVPADRLTKVHAPIGLNIGAVTPAEIAISIAAELVAVRRGREHLPATSMKIDETPLRQWFNRNKT